MELPSDHWAEHLRPLWTNQVKEGLGGMFGVSCDEGNGAAAILQEGEEINQAILRTDFLTGLGLNLKDLLHGVSNVVRCGGL